MPKENLADFLSDYLRLYLNDYLSKNRSRVTGLLCPLHRSDYRKRKRLSLRKSLRFYSGPFLLADFCTVELLTQCAPTVITPSCVNRRLYNADLK